MTTLRMGERELSMVDDVNDIPVFATDEEAAAFWADHWAGPHLSQQMDALGMPAEMGRD